MFGYLRPLKGELKVREYEQYKAYHCGLCHTLKKGYGLFGRFIINYDFTFLTIIFSSSNKSDCYLQKKCIASPFRKKCVFAFSPELEFISDLNVILFYWSLLDKTNDEKGIYPAAARIASLFLRRAYKKAASRQKKFDKKVEECITDLNILEKESCDSIDKTADTFARILQAVSEHEQDDKRKRILSQLFYHVGRWIYITDAYNDFERDIKSGRITALCSYPDVTILSPLDTRLLIAILSPCVAFIVKITFSGFGTENIFAASSRHSNAIFAASIAFL